jgi:hypothetical protein
MWAIFSGAKQSPSRDSTSDDRHLAKRGLDADATNFAEAAA